MVTYTKDEKNLTIPSALGNFASNGGGSGVTPAEVERMIESALTEYDETVQGYIADVDVDVEQNKEDIQDLSGTTSALTEGLNSLSGTVSSMGEEIVSLSGQTAQITAITAQIEALSGVTSGISNDLSSLGSDVEELSGVTSGIAVDLQALSAYTESIVIPDMDNYTTTAVTAELSAATSGLAVELAELNQKVPNAVVLNLLTNEERKALYDEISPYFINGNLSSGFPVDKYEFFYWAGDRQIDNTNIRGFVRLDISKEMGGIVFAGNAVAVSQIFVDGALYQVIYSYKIDSSGNGGLIKKDVRPYSLPTAAANTLGGVKVGSGLTIDGNGVLSVSGESSSGPVIVDLDALTQQERAALYQTLWTVSGSANEEYLFFAKFNEIEANTPLFLQVQNFNPDDYGGSIFLCGASSIRHLSSVIITYRYVLINDGTFEKDRGVYDISKSIASAQSLGEIRVGSGLTIDQDGILSVSGGSSSGPEIIDLDALSQAEILALYTELYQTTSADTINEKYYFYKAFDNGNIGPLKIELTYSDYFGRIIFSGAWLNPNDDNKIWAAKVWINSEGNFETVSLQNIKSAPEKNTDYVGYYDDISRYIVFDKGTSALTDWEGTALVNGRGFGGSFYWFVANPIDGSWGQAIPVLSFKVIDENDVETMYYNPTYSTKNIAAVTVDGVEYNKQFTAKYRDFEFSMLINSTPQGANFSYTQL